jgi:hypothetical protein
MICTLLAASNLAALHTSKVSRPAHAQHGPPLGAYKVEVDPTIMQVLWDAAGTRSTS